LSQVLSVSRGMVNIFKPLPMPMRVFIFRVYNRCLKLIGGRGRIYKATTRFGAEINCEIGDLIQSYIFYFGVWEPAISKLTTTLLCEGDVYIDVGANIGYDSLLASQCVGNLGRVVAIEASPTIYELLKKNIEQNMVSNIRSVNIAASNFVGELSLYFGGDDNIGATTTIQSRGMVGQCRIKALPFTEILLDWELPRAKLVKIDIEGGELPVLGNIVDYIDRFSDELSIIVEASAHEDKAGWAEISRRYQAAGFNLYEIENLYSLSWYLRDDKEYRLKRLGEIPDRQVDILFTRKMIDVLGLVY